ncbi:MAG: hypothetical protein KDB00_07190 [Planctomycetales bacterium]|nr:hypothetical protein [Planctomycetales bacterium]
MDGSRSRQTAAESSDTQPTSTRDQAWGRAARGRRLKSARSLRRGHRRRLGAALETLEKRNLLTFAIDLFADINMLGISSDVDEVVQVGGEVFFVADDGVHGKELWKSNGSEAGTVMVKDILPGPDTSNPQGLTVVGDEVFFVALDQDGGEDLWKSDGTEAGTQLVYDSAVDGTYYFAELTESGGKLFFTLGEPTAVPYEPSYELWVSDGTTAGTKLVKDINPVAGILDGPRELTDVDGTLFFTSYSSGYDDRELWKSDGTEGGTVLVADLGIDPGIDPIDPADDDPLFSSEPRYLTNVNGVLYFAAEDFTDGIELYKSDGTTAGTVRVGDLNPTGDADPQELTPFGGELFFSATDGTLSPDGAILRHLYKSDGNGITLVADTTGGLGSSAPRDLEVVGSTLFFAANGWIPATTVSASSPQMTADNSRLFSSGYAGIVSAVASPYNGELSGFNSSVNFSTTTQGGTNDGPGWAGPAPTGADPDPVSNAQIGDPGVGLRSIAVGDLYVEDIDSFDLTVDAWEWTIADPSGLTNITFSGFASGNEFDSSDAGENEGLFFELFLNGSTTPVSTTQVSGDDLDNWFAGRDANNVNLFDPGGAAVTTATVRLSVPSASFTSFAEGGNEAFVVGATLTADLDVATTQRVDAKRELHKTDGTTAGTVMVKDIVPMGGSNPFQLTEVGGKLFFAADDVFGDGLELWTSDGTEAGTVQVFDSLPGTGLDGAPLDGAPRLFGDFDGRLIFTTNDGFRDRELWISDGSELNTERIANINPSTDDADVTDLVRFGADLFFVANDGLNGEAIWRANTNDGTVEMFADVSPSSADKISKVTVFSSASEQIVFYNNALGSEGGVYITNPDGSLTQLFDHRPVELDSEGTMFVVSNSTIYFVADDGINGYELWQTNGAGPASPVTDFIPGPTGSNPGNLVEFGGTLFFTADTGTGSTFGDIGRELFMTNGFFTGLAADIQLGAGSSSPDQLIVVGSNLYFTANDGTNGRELWRRNSSGTTQMVVDINPNAGSSDPIGLTNVNGVLYFAANNGSNGFEPYRTGTGGAFQIANINPGGASSNPSGFFQALGEVYFSADDGTTGRELWKTSGVSGNATQVANIQADGSSAPVPLYDTGQRLIFSAAETVYDRELWATDGAGITLLVEDLYPPEYFGSNPEEVIEVNGKLYFAAENGPFGRELFVLEEVAPSVMEVIVGGDPGAPVAESQRSTLDMVTVVFDGNVTVPASAVQLVNLDTGTALTSMIVNTRYEYGKTYVEITFGSGAYVVDRDPSASTGLRSSLADGNYQLTILSVNVTSPVSGRDMAADFVFGDAATDQFFRYFGDSDGDRDVDAEDFGQLALSFLKTTGTSGYNEDLDFDGDGDVDGLDYGRFEQRFLKRLN